MSKYDKRLDRLERRANELHPKINVFIPNKQLIVVREYYKALLDEQEAHTEALQRIYNQIDELNKEFLQNKELDYYQELTKLSKGNDLFVRAFFYKHAEKQCKDFPDGHWIPKKMAQSWYQEFNEARAYFCKKGNLFYLDL